jgi:hypothetical protein
MMGSKTVRLVSGGAVIGISTLAMLRTAPSSAILFSMNGKQTMAFVAGLGGRDIRLGLTTIRLGDHPVTVDGNVLSLGL